MKKVAAAAGAMVFLFVVVFLLLGDRVESATIRIVDLDCACDVEEVQATLMAVPGVRSVELDFDQRTAVVTYQSSDCTPEDLEAAIHELGYQTENLTGRPQKEEGSEDGVDVRLDARL